MIGDFFEYFLNALAAAKIIVISNDFCSPDEHKPAESPLSMFSIIKSDLWQPTLLPPIKASISLFFSL